MCAIIQTQVSFFTLINHSELNAGHLSASFFSCSGLQFFEEEVRWPGGWDFLKAWGPYWQSDWQSEQFLSFNSYVCFSDCHSTSRKWWCRTGSGRERMRFTIRLKFHHFDSQQPRHLFILCWSSIFFIILLVLLFSCSLKPRSSDGQQWEEVPSMYNCPALYTSYSFLNRCDATSSMAAQFTAKANYLHEERKKTFVVYCIL